MTQRKPTPSPADINEVNSEFWRRESEEAEQLAVKWPDHYVEAARLAMEMEPAMRCLGACIGFHDDERRQAAMTALLKAAAVASVHAQLRKVEPRRERERQRGRDRANSNREGAAYTGIRNHFHAWQEAAAGSLKGMTQDEQVSAFCKYALIYGRRLTRHERGRMRDLLEFWSALAASR